MTDRTSTLRYAPNAERDLLIQADYHESTGSFAVAERFVRAIAQTAELLRTAPQIGRIVRAGTAGHRELRSVPVSGPFKQWLVFYSIHSDFIRIERIIHSSRDLPDLYP